MEDPVMKVLVAGCRGMLGTDLMQGLDPHVPLGLDLPELDITDARRCREQVLDFKPEVVIHAAALTNVDWCEAHEQEALLVNGQGTGNLAAAAHEAGALFVYYSTDYVFDGIKESAYLETDPTHPLSAYGRSKLCGEEMTRSHGPNHLILRTSWLFGRNGKNFIRTIVEMARDGQPLHVVDDQLGSPTYARDLALQTWNMVRRGCRGTYHVTNSDFCSWYELARRCVEWAAVPGAHIEPVKTHEYPRPAPRPACSILANARLLSEGVPLLRSWQEAAREYVTTCLPAL